MLDSDWRGEPARAAVPPPLPPSLQEALSEVETQTPPEASLGARLESLGDIEEAAESPSLGPDLARLLGGSGGEPRAAPPPVPFTGAGLASPAVAAWIKRARRRRFRAALQQIGAWMITAMTIALIAGAAAFALLGLGA